MVEFRFLNRFSLRLCGSIIDVVSLGDLGGSIGF
jgi:hypothetical protein